MCTFTALLRIVDYISRPCTIHNDYFVIVLFFITRVVVKPSIYYWHQKSRFLGSKIGKQVLNKHISTEQMHEDPMTKGLLPSLHEGQLKDMGLIDTSWIVSFVSNSLLQYPDIISYLCLEYFVLTYFCTGESYLCI